MCGSVVGYSQQSKCWRGEPMRSIESVCHQIQRQINDCELLTAAKENKHTQAPHSWATPSKDMLKKYIDESATTDNSIGGWGFVIGDHMGHVIADASNLPHIMNPL